MSPLIFTMSLVILWAGWVLRCQIKDPAADELRELALHAVKGVERGAVPKPEKFMEFVYGTELVQLEIFMSQVKVRSSHHLDVEAPHVTKYPRRVSRVMLRSCPVQGIVYHIVWPFAVEQLGLQ